MGGQHPLRNDADAYVYFWMGLRNDPQSPAIGINTAKLSFFWMAPGASSFVNVSADNGAATATDCGRGWYRYALDSGRVDDGDGVGVFAVTWTQGTLANGEVQPQAYIDMRVLVAGVDANGISRVGVRAIEANVINATAVADDTIDGGAIAASGVTKIQANLATSAAQTTAQTDLTTLTGRLSALRAGYLDNLNVGGNVASSAEVVSIQNNTRVVRVVNGVIERPDAGTTTYRIELLLYDSVGNMEAPDSAPTIALVNQVGTDRSARLDSPTMALVSSGRYRAIYTADVADPLEQLVWTFSVVEGGNTRLYGNTSVVVDTTAVDFTAADRTKLDRIDADYTTARAVKIDNLDTTVSSRAAAADLATVAGYIDTEVGAIKAKTDNLPADPSSASTIAAAFTGVNTKLDTIDDFLDTEIGAIKAKTDGLPPDPADASDINTAFGTVNTTLSTIAGYLDTEILAIKAKTDTLPAAPADQTLLMAAIVALQATSNDIAGLLHRNARLDSQTYDGDGRMLTARLRVFADLAAANLSDKTHANDVDGEIARYSITAEYDGSGNCTSYKLVKDL